MDSASSARAAVAAVGQPLLFVVMDGVGERQESFGNAVRLAPTPHLDTLRAQHPWTRLWAHGPHVGLASLQDMGNSEVGHNTIGAGRIYDQGAKCVATAIAAGEIYSGAVWQRLIAHLKQHGSALHFLGLLSDGNVHSHHAHLHALMEQACRDGITTLRLHILLDGRDVPPQSAPIYLRALMAKITELSQRYSADIAVASGGGRMRLTMDRYEADWAMVRRGWQHHVLGQGTPYSSMASYLDELSHMDYASDQYLEGFVIHDDQGQPCGPIRDGDGVVCFNFRADRAVEITRAFCEPSFSEFQRQVVPKVMYVGLTCYDGDKSLPQDYLVTGPQIKQSLGWLMSQWGVRQWACSETQKFGHITFFWNGNRADPFEPSLETYVEIPSLAAPPDQHPQMQAAAITQHTIQALRSGQYDFLRVNYPNGDMVGHSGHLEAAITAMTVVDQMIGALMKACLSTGTALLVTADHGNCELMQARVRPLHSQSVSQIRPVTSHSTHPVPLYLYNARCLAGQDPAEVFMPSSAQFAPGLAHLAATSLQVMGLPPWADFEPSLLRVKSP